MMTHGRFGHSDICGQIATAQLAGLRAEQQRHKLDPYRVGEGLEAQGDVQRCGVVQRPGCDR